MERQRLDNLTLQELKVEALRYGFRAPYNRERCIDVIMSHLEQNSPLLDILKAQ